MNNSQTDLVRQEAGVAVPSRESVFLAAQIARLLDTVTSLPMEQDEFELGASSLTSEGLHQLLTEFKAISGFHALSTGT